MTSFLTFSCNFLKNAPEYIDPSDPVISVFYEILVERHIGVVLEVLLVVG